MNSANYRKGLIPKIIFIICTEFVFLCMCVSGEDWDQKVSATSHTKKIQKTPKQPPKGVYVCVKILIQSRNAGGCSKIHMYYEIKNFYLFKKKLEWLQLLLLFLVRKLVLVL
jgi:hypothetical protein